MRLPDGLTLTGGDGLTRAFFRTKFWEEDPQTYGDIVFQPDALPEPVARTPLSSPKELPAALRRRRAVLFVGHYWRSGKPAPIRRTWPAWTTVRAVRQAGGLPTGSGNPPRSAQVRLGRRRAPQGSMSAVPVLRLPLAVDLSGFVKLLQRMQVPHRVSEEAGEQVLWVPGKRRRARRCTNASRRRSRSTTGYPAQPSRARALPSTNTPGDGVGAAASLIVGG
jgi:hypothetical protein